ncbi:hypothetical protein B0H14DRAFT_2617834 [Mycena olivaceomarginata]|nr:hypothetical protein B0H14DRAFT_2617834 [Mycena olivaceomarginata]
MELGRPLPARMGLACHKCWKEMDVQLSRCGGCHRVSYCGTGGLEIPQTHVQGSQLAREKFRLAATLVPLHPKEPITDLGQLRERTEHQIAICPYFTAESGIRFLRAFPLVLIALPFSSTRTAMVIRMEIAMNGTTADNMKHLRLHQGPSEDLRDGLSQCEMNKYTRGQIMFKTAMTSWLDQYGQLVWIPKRVKSGWVVSEGGILDSMPWKNLLKQLDLLKRLEKQG